MPVVEQKGVPPAEVRKTHAGVTITSFMDPVKTNKTVQWFGAKDMRIVEKKKPVVTDGHDVVLKITTTAICGSDLHLYLNYVSGMQKGDVMGHEFMGIVEEVGPDVHNIQVGDRVVAAFDIGCIRMPCGSCDDKHQAYSGCDNTNDSDKQETLYGHRTSGIYGYTHLTGGWDGGQAQYVRVPFADRNLIKVPQGFDDKKYIFLSDIFPTGWHATELGRVQEGDVVAIWGCGPVGMLAAASALYKKASRVILIDNQQYRLDYAKKKMPKVETINFSTRPTLEQLREMVPHGPDVCIEAVGMHYADATHKAMMLAGLEQDPSNILNELIMATRKGGRIGVVGVYVGYTNQFNIGAFMEKGLSMAAGQTPCQKYWPTLLSLIEKGEIDPSFVISHEMDLEQAPEGYKMFNEKSEGCIKVILHPKHGAEQ